MAKKQGEFRWGGFLLAALGGLLVGALTALFVAPQKGSQTRRQVAGYLKDGRQAVQRIPWPVREGAALVMRNIL